MTSLFARFLRKIIVIAVLAAVLAPLRAEAAPFAAIVMDARSGEVLYEKNADARLHPASLTKMMTLYIVFQEIEAGRIHLDDKVTVSAHAAGQPPSRLGLKAGQKIAVRYLIRAAAVKSANDAATALGEHVGGGEAAFAKRMTKTARALGMTNSTFRNANGLTAEGHLSTARDMTTLGRHLFYDFPQYYNIFSRRTADAGMATVRNTNSRFLDGYEGADGIKTGYTVAAGFNLTASAQRGKKRIIATVFGGTSTAARNAKMAELMDVGFAAARNNVREKVPEAAPIPEDMLLAEAAPPIDTPDVEGGAAKTVRVSGAVTRSLRPKSRPAVAEVPDAVAIAIAEGIDGALDEALAPPPPEGTLEAQVVDLAEATAPTLPPDAAAGLLADPAAITEAVSEALPAEGSLEAQAVALAEGPAPAPPAEGSLEAQALALAEGPAPTPPAEGSLEAQALALAEGTAPTPPAEGSLEAQALALAEGPAAPAETVDPALIAARPQPRPEVRPEAPAEAAQPVELALAEAPAPLATPEAAAPTEEVAAAPVPEARPLDPAAVTAVESVAAVAPPSLPAATEAPAQPLRNAPIFESPEPAVELAAAEGPEVEELVVVKSTSGDGNWGVNVGDFTSHAEAERALLKTALAESATLNQGLRRITRDNGGFHANFMGMTEGQAELACRRLHARGITCETLGPS